MSILLINWGLIRIMIDKGFWGEIGKREMKRWVLVTKGNNHQRSEKGLLGRRGLEAV